jgi:hypothetical protein
MAKTVTVTSSGMSNPINIWVCDSCDAGATCQYITTTSSSSYSFTLPSNYEGYATFGIKVIDADECQFCDTVTN